MNKFDYERADSGLCRVLCCGQVVCSVIDTYWATKIVDALNRNEVMTQEKIGDIFDRVAQLVTLQIQLHSKQNKGEELKHYIEDYNLLREELIETILHGGSNVE